MKPSGSWHRNHIHVSDKSFARTEPLPVVYPLTSKHKCIILQRVLNTQWQGEFCCCSIDVVGGKQCNGGVDHLERFRHHTGASAKAGKPMTQPTVDPLNCHRFILADIVPPNRQERVVRPIIICTVQLQGFSRSSNRFSVAASPHSQSTRQSDQKPTRSTACSFFLKEVPELIQFHHNHALARLWLKARRVRCGMSSDPIQN